MKTTVQKDPLGHKVMSSVGVDELTPIIARLERATERYLAEVQELARAAESAAGLERFPFVGPTCYWNGDYEVPASICLEPLLVSFRAYRRAKDINVITAEDERYMTLRLAEAMA